MEMSKRPPVWYLPSFYGDIRLEQKPEAKCIVTLEQLTKQEQQAVRELRKHALKSRFLGRPWATAESFPDIIDCDGGYRSSAVHRIVLEAPIEQVQKVLSKALKPGQSLVSAVRFTSGRIEETVVAEPKNDEDEPKSESKDDETKKDDTKKDKPEAGTTVAAPRKGCPMPEFESVELKATRVLYAFLDEGQRDDFARHNRFVAVGADSGHRYLVTSRHRMYTGRGQLYDLDMEEPLCVHDWDVPAPEEMLAILVHLSLPGRENYLRYLPLGH